MAERLPENPLVRRVLEVCVRELGIVEVARRLGVTAVLVDLWRTGKADVPPGEFRQLVDILVEVKPGWEDWDKA